MQDQAALGTHLGFPRGLYFYFCFITLTLVSLGDFVDSLLTKFDLCEFRRLFKDPMKDFLAVSLVFVF